MSPTPKFPPARGYSWPQATKGNTLAVKSGANSERIVSPLAAEAYDELVAVIVEEDIEFLQRPSFRIALENVAWSLAQVMLYRQRVTEHPDDVGAANQLDKHELRLDNRFAACGLTPASRSKLQQALSQTVRNTADLTTLIEKGQAIREARQRKDETSATDTMSETEVSGPPR